MLFPVVAMLQTKRLVFIAAITTFLVIAWNEFHNSSVDPSTPMDVMPVDTKIVLSPSTGFPSNFTVRDTSNYERVVEKKVFSERLRLVYFAGLEGTGHHFFNSVIDKCQQRHWCVSQCNVSEAFYPDLATANSFDAYGEAIVKLEYGLEDILRKKEKVSQGTSREGGSGALIIPINTNKGCSGSTGMMSYPNFNGPNKAVQHVNMRLMAQMAEEKGLDLRIVYLQRSPEGIIGSTSRRGIGGSLMREIRVLRVNANALSRMLSGLDSAFLDCFRFDIEEDPEQLGRISGFLSPDAVVATGIKDLLAQTYVKPSDEHHSWQLEGRQFNTAPSEEGTGVASARLRHTFIDELVDDILDVEEVARCRQPIIPSA